MTTELHALRHEPASGTQPAPTRTWLDYSNAGIKIDAAMLHLNEALPNAQRQRATLAYRLLRAGVDELGVWLRATGHDV